MSKLRIAVWHNLPSGGGKRQLFEHVRGLVERGHHVESWCPDSAAGDFLPLGELVEEHVLPLDDRRDIYHSPIRSLPVVRSLLGTLERHCRACAAEIRRGGFDLLYANACLYLRTSPIAGMVDLPSAIYLGEPYRWFYEALPELPWIAPPDEPRRGTILDSLRRRLEQRRKLDGMRVQARAELEYTRAFDRILVNSAFSRETVLRTFNLESKVCYLGIDTEHFRPGGEPKAGFVVGLGTIYHGKGVDRAIRALGTLPADRRPALIWIGNGASEPDLAAYRGLAGELGVDFEPRIHIPDAEVVRLLGQALAMVYTSRLEPFGLAPLEANACGTTVVGIAEGGVRESIQEGVNGRLARDDDPRALGELIGRLVDDPRVAVEEGLRARRHVEANWSLRMGTDNIETLLLELAGAGSRGEAAGRGASAP